MASDAEQIYGALPDKWRMTTVAELCMDGEAGVQTGPFGTMLHASAYQPNGTPVVAVKNIGDNHLVHDEIPRVDDSTVQRLSRYRLQRGDILFGRKGAVERRAYVDGSEEGWLQGSDCIRLRVSGTNLDSRFLSFVLGSEAYRSWITQHAHGATMPSLNQEIVKRIPIPLPPPDEQRAIADVLGTLDRKIELNRTISETLESMARALFKSWFIDFDPVGAKAEKRDPGVPRTLADLFASSFEQSEVGDIPKNWNVVGLDQIGRFLNGLALQKFPPQDGRFLPVIKIAQLRTENTSDADMASADLAPEYVVNDGDVLFSWSGSLECILWAGGQGALNQHLFKVTSESYPKWFYFLWIGEHLDEFRHIAAGKATTMGHIQRGHLSAAKVLIPPAELLNEMSHHFAPLINQIVQLKVASKTLAAIRDALLPKLISGDLRVPDVERIGGGQV
jgi:type I restriction enzyme, S subunit